MPNEGPHVPTTPCISPIELQFQGRRIIVSADGRRISSDGGVILLRQLDDRLGLTGRMTALLDAGRDVSGCGTRGASSFDSGSTRSAWATTTATRPSGCATIRRSNSRATRVGTAPLRSVAINSEGVARQRQADGVWPPLPCYRQASHGRELRLHRPCWGTGSRCACEFW